MNNELYEELRESFLENEELVKFIAEVTLGDGLFSLRSAITLLGELTVKETSIRDLILNMLTHIEDLCSMEDLVKLFRFEERLIIDKRLPVNESYTKTDAAVIFILISFLLQGEEKMFEKILRNSAHKNIAGFTNIKLLLSPKDVFDLIVNDNANIHAAFILTLLLHFKGEEYYNMDSYNKKVKILESTDLIPGLDKNKLLNAKYSLTKDAQLFNLILPVIINIIKND